MEAFLDSSCTDFNANIAIAARHAITEAQYDELVKKRFGFTNVQHKTYTPQDLGISPAVDCKKFCISYSSDYSNSNSDIKISIEPYQQDNRYSVQLFLGVLHLFNVDRFEFTKGGDWVDELVIFRVIHNNVIVYRGDISTIFPYMTM